MKLVSLIEDEMGLWPTTSSLNRVLRMSLELAKRVEEAPVATVDPLTHGGFGVIVTARDMAGQRVALVPLAQQSET